jgi:hypothetical protein
MRGKSTLTHATSEMGGFSIGRSAHAPTPEIPHRGAGVGAKKRGSGIGRGGATYPEFGLESVPHTGTTTTGMTMSYASMDLDPDAMDLPAVWFETGVGAEELFGEKREGELPETVTWFGDRDRDRDRERGAGDACGGGGTSEEDVEMDVSP